MYILKFVPAAVDEWKSLDGSVKELFKHALKKRLEQPRLPGSELKGDLKGCYKIKLAKQGYRLIYEIENDKTAILVLAINKREDLLAYLLASRRRQDLKSD
jgi:mRNA interferase RelE/StbE